MSDPIPPRGSGAAAIMLTRVLRAGRPHAREALSRADPSRVKRVLVVKSHDQLGDFVLATPAVQALRERFPSARVVVVTREFLAPLARRVPDIEVVELTRVRGARGVAALTAALTTVAALRPDLAFVLNSVSRSRTADAVAALSGAGLVVGRSRVGPGPLPAHLSGDPFAAACSRPRRDPVYDLDLDFAPGSDHQVERLLDLVRWCAPPSSAAPRLVLSETERAVAWKAFEQAFPDGPVLSPRIGYHPGAANPLKCWPLDSFVELGVALGAGSGGPGPARFVFDSPRERGRGAALCAGLAARGSPAALLPPGGIEWFAALCSHLDLLVCNDSGVMHIAAALGVPTLSFHSLGRPREWAPVSGSAIALWAPADIASLPVRVALEAARRLLETTPGER